MLSQFSGARVLDTGDYEIDGNRYPWVELMQRADELPAGAPVRPQSARRYSLSLGFEGEGDEKRRVPLPSLAFGDVVDGWIEDSDQSKVLKGTDRALGVVKLSIVALTKSAPASASVRGSRQPAEAAA